MSPSSRTSVGIPAESAPPLLRLSRAVPTECRGDILRARPGPLLVPAILVGAARCMSLSACSHGVFVIRHNEGQLCMFGALPSLAPSVWWHKMVFHVPGCVCHPQQAVQDAAWASLLLALKICLLSVVPTVNSLMSLTCCELCVAITCIENV